LEYGGYAVDQLYLTVKNTLLNNFTYGTHTYDHPELTNLTYAQVKAELVDNYAATLQLFGGYHHARYSNLSMVTPSISGLMNGAALQALWDQGIRHVTADNSVPALRTPFAYHGWYTNLTSNGFAGMYVIPREATNIYYDCQTPEQSVSEYNHLYFSYYGYNSTFDEIIAREVARVTLNLLAYRYDPYMFHQGNIHEFTYNGQTTSLLTYWLQNIVAGITAYYNLPIQSHNYDLLAQKWLDREARDNCGFSGTLQVVNGKITSIAGTSTAACQIAISGAGLSVTPASSAVTLETYGPDTTVWVNLAANGKFTQAIKTPITL